MFYNSYYPRHLMREWYTSDVCNYIHASLEGAKKWNASVFDNEYERSAFIETFEQCQQFVKENDMHPQAMLKVLSDFHDALAFSYLEVKPPFFSFARWFYDRTKVREKAIKMAFELVSGICNRFLP